MRRPLGRLRARLRWALSRHAAAVPMRWVRRPELSADAEVCLFVTVVRAGVIAPHALLHAAAWKRQGFDVVLIAVVDEVEARAPDVPEWLDGVVVRANRGYDFGAWSAVIRQLDLARIDRLVIANDSVIGPLQGFAELVRRARSSAADVVGLTRNDSPAAHLQSYVVVFSARALRDPAFTRFWARVRTGDRQLVIDRCEVRMTQQLEASGLRWEALYRLPQLEEANLTLRYWRELLDIGFPFVKVQLLRDNPFSVDLDGWRGRLEQDDYDIAAADAALGR